MHYLIGASYLLFVRKQVSLYTFPMWLDVTVTRAGQPMESDIIRLGSSSRGRFWRHQQTGSLCIRTLSKRFICDILFRRHGRGV